MAYRQTDYQQIQGINGRYTIHDIGCFITSFCNLLTRFGRSIDPPSINAAFIQRNSYIDVDDGIRDDVGWDTITKYDSNVVVTSTGGPGIPPTNNAIVKFIYNSFQTGKPTTHFCLVDHISNGVVYILDSWDGVVKDAAHYGGVKAWATYENRQVINQGGSAVNDKFTNEAEVKPFYVLLRGNEATLQERQGWVGRPKIDFITSPNTAIEAKNNAANLKQAEIDRDNARTDAGNKQAKIEALQTQLDAALKSQQSQQTTGGDSVATAADKADAEAFRQIKKSLKALLS